MSDRKTSRSTDAGRVLAMTTPPGREDSLGALDGPTRALVRLAARIAAGTEPEIRDEMALAAPVVPPEWVEELVLQSYLFAGFPRALNAMREWRRTSGRAAPAVDEGAVPAEQWRRRGETTCAAVYGDVYERLRRNIRELHPALDSWMISEGYGQVLSRPGLDLIRRELCVVAACAASRQDRQLHSHLHGALNVGARPAVVDETLDALDGIVAPEALRSQRMLWARVRGK